MSSFSARPSAPAQTKWHLILLWPLLAAVLLARVLFAVLAWLLNGAGSFLSPDTLTYVVPAQSLLHGYFSVGGTPEIVRTPGYPLFLLPAVATHHWIFVGLLENFCLAIASTILIWKVARELFPLSKAAWWAVLLYCFEPVSFLYAEKVLSDLLFSTQLLLFIWLSLRFLRNLAFGTLLCSAAVLGIATYTRPVSLFLGLWLVPFFLMSPRQIPWGKRIAHATVFVLTFLVTLAPWIVRNTEVAGYRGFSAITDVNLYFYSAAAIKARLAHESYAQAQQELGWDPQIYFKMHPEQRRWPQARIFQFQSTEARRLISEHRLLYAKIHLTGCIVVMLDPAATEAMKFLRFYPESGGLIYRAADHGPKQALFWLIRNYPLAGAAFFVLGGQLLLFYWLGWKGLRLLPFETGIFFIFLSVYFVLISGSSYAVARFRMPIMPLICVAGGVAIGHRHRTVAEPRRAEQ